METTGDSTDPRGTKRPLEDPILVSTDVFRPVIVVNRPPKVCLPLHLQPSDAYGLFSLFFNDHMLDTIAKHTNTYGTHKYLKAAWFNTSPTELRAFLGVLVYRSLYPHPKHKDFWNIHTIKPVHIGLTNALSRDRFAQLESCIHLSDPDVKGDVFSKLEPVNSMLLATCKAFWQPSSTLAVDECMSRFTGRAKEKISIPTKPIPTGFKGWVIADQGYFLHWFWHAKGDGPQGIGKIPKPLGKNKTAAVISALLNTLPKGPPGTYSVTIDNLFTSTKLLTYLSAEGFGARGTARTNAGVHQELIKHKKSDRNDIIPWGTKHLKYVAEGAVAQLGWKDSAYCIFMSNMDSGIDTVVTKRRRPNETATCAKTARVPFGDQPVKDLPRPTLTYFYNIEMNQVDRGDQMRAPYPIQQRQLKGWKAMFYTMVGIVVVNSYLLSSYASVPRKKKFVSHLAFREALYKALFQHSTGAEAVIANTANILLPVAGPANFKLPPGDSIPIVDTEGSEARATAKTAHIAGEILAQATADAKIEHQRVSIKRAPCVMCKQAAKEKRRGIRGQPRRAFQDLLPNTVSRSKDRHVARATTGCASCNVPLCKGKRCWDDFHSVVN